ncbi:gliding motility-associated C-terminal domain-containing protein [Spirosoma sp.]|uniref:T9SS type B sorting domain-containing protein n=1 Tax=Spirosoma sp. TaxID=1899569 RepID=UPI0026054A67|nr:gliding motility-associated C-terminal domain-containing protein [Spirosoma sp.]MCX6214584.1 gliding motility-associated C-terminal domain-containing protein [Spirosoma sp.]
MKKSLIFTIILFINLIKGTAQGEYLLTKNTTIIDVRSNSNSNDQKAIGISLMPVINLITCELHFCTNNAYINTSLISLTDSLILQSPDTYCRGSTPILTVTGKNIKWYADADKKQLLYKGNTYQSPSLDQTTTFYLTQTVGVDSSESTVIPIIIEIVEAYLVNIIATPASCGENNGVISITATGGTARNPLQYSINNGPLQTSPVFTNLSAGTYTVMNRIANCWGTKDVIISSPPSPTISNVVSIDPQCGNTNGALTIFASGGNGSLSYALNGVDFKTENQFTNLPGGTYTIMVKDQDQCTASKAVSLKKTDSLQLKQIDIVATTCGKKNGRISAIIKQGNGRINYSIDGSTYQVSNTFDNLSSGAYTVFIQDETGCRDTRSILIGNSEGPTIGHIDTIPPACGVTDGQIIVNAISQRGLSYSLNGMAYQRDSSFGQLSAGHYDVSVKDDLGCTVEQPVVLSEPCEYAIHLPDAFTPNQDGTNEGWVIFFPFTSLQLNELTIFDRWGEIIFHDTPRVINNGDLLWNGVYRGQLVVGLYAYQLKVQFPNGKNYVYRGTVFLVR